MTNKPYHRFIFLLGILAFSPFLLVPAFSPTIHMQPLIKRRQRCQVPRLIPRKNHLKSRSQPMMELLQLNQAKPVFHLNRKLNRQVRPKQARNHRSTLSKRTAK